MVAIKVEDPIGLINANQLPRAKVHQIESTNQEDELQTAQLKKENFGSTRENPSFEKVKSHGQQLLVSPAKRDNNKMNPIDI